MARVRGPLGNLFANISYYVSFLASVGRSFLDLLRLASARFPSATPVQIENAVVEGQLAAKAGGILGFSFNRRVGDQNVPINPELPNQYRYVGVVRCLAEGDDSFTQDIVVYDTDERMTFSQLDPLMVSLRRGRSRATLHGGNAPDEMPAGCSLWSITSVERRS